MYLNKAIVIGNLTRDPELRALPSGIKVCSFSLATNRVWKDKNGAKQESADYHNVVVFGRQAETVAQYMKKGNSMLVEGRMQTRSWDDKDGSKKYRTEIIADRTQFGPKGNAGSSGGTQTAPGMTSGPKGEEAEADMIEYPEEDINPEDIPF
ncbi:single-stranded DNA-binding protein [Candidatus Nomurabacteria bacterium]|nr:single-stranded DNA-binding protein [Candidatus Nomurabacteria bacterium]